MEFLETFGYIWSSREVIRVIIGRAMHGSDLPERRHELARHLRFGATRRSRPSSYSDLTAATPRGRSGCVDLRATNKPGATS
ncbi:hypothetical protein F2Q69_00009544 [Brassica cretica]|uniref:Uncharacterized protein n=1 Tax=Brassica cretica TaxID=69181 RepID=A0A8S9P7B6_BRACR|nr:hypothetical protein F2Q69_00009544 [Brassica cretica]